MSAMGFNLSGEEYVLTPSAQAWEVLIACQSKLDRFMARYIETKEKGGSWPQCGVLRALSDWRRRQSHLLPRA